MGNLVYLLGSLISLVGWVMLLIKAFQKSVLWGIVSLVFCTFGALIFGVVNWSDPVARKGLLVMLGGWVLCIIGAVLGGAGMIMKMLHH